MRQLSIFDENPVEPQHEVLHKHDRVKLLLIEESIDSEIHNYRKYYCDHLIEKIGTVVEVKGNTAEVQFAEEVIVCDVCELEWIA